MVELNILHDLQSQCEVAEETVDPEKTDKAEVAEQLVQWLSAVLANNLAEIWVRTRYLSPRI